MSNEFPKILTNYLTVYLPTQCNYSKNTIASYCDTFRIILRYVKTEKGIATDKLSLKDFNYEWVISFLDWLSNSQGNSVSTLNQRLACIHSFFRYIQADYPQYLLEYQKILRIPFKKNPPPNVNYLCSEDVKFLLQQPDSKSKSGRRDVTMLSLLYDTGARVQELVDLRVDSLRLEAPSYVTLTGKGNKTRHVPLMDNTVKLLKTYLEENHLLESYAAQHPLFVNHSKQKFTRAGVTYILKKYATQARTVNPKFPDKISPHVLRHSKAMHLLEAGVNVIYIRDILGHADVSTTGVYARANLEMKRKALEKSENISETVIPSWTQNRDLLEWLNAFGQTLK